MKLLALFFVFTAAVSVKLALTTGVEEAVLRPVPGLLLVCEWIFALRSARTGGRYF